jgi:hypothetical protein
MEEYCLDLKGQVICIKEISEHCKCYRCLHEKKEGETASGAFAPVDHIEKQEN